MLYYYLVLLVKRTILICTGKESQSWSSWVLFKAFLDRVVTYYSVSCRPPLAMENGSQVGVSICAPSFEFNPDYCLKIMSIAVL